MGKITVLIRQIVRLIMKTKFNISDSVFDQGFSTLEECFDFYEKYYKPQGYLLDKEREEVYKIFDNEIHLKEGDRVCLDTIRTVTWKCIFIEEGVIEYVVEDR